MCRGQRACRFTPSRGRHTCVRSTVLGPPTSHVLALHRGGALGGAPGVLEPSPPVELKVLLEGQTRVSRDLTRPLVPSFKTRELQPTWRFIMPPQISWYFPVLCNRFHWMCWRGSPAMAGLDCCSSCLIIYFSGLFLGITAAASVAAAQPKRVKEKLISNNY